MTYPELPNERGPAKYFLGRHKIQDSFKYQLKNAVKRKEGGGTTFLIQAPPGAGKTALLDHCRKLAALHGWQTAKINAMSLWNSDDMRDSLGRKWHDAVKGITIGGELMPIPATRLRVDFNKHATSPLRMVKGGKKPLLLFMDEGQLMGGLVNLAEEHKGKATSLLENIHNGTAGRPVILLVAGLGMTRESLRVLGISRYEAGCFTEMGGLDEESERNLIMRWMVYEAGISFRDATPWVYKIIKETSGWPRHITGYLIPALTEIYKANGRLTKDGLDAALEAGRIRKVEYYAARAYGLRRKERTSFARLIAEAPSDGNLEEMIILQKLSTEYGEQKATELVADALAAGVLYYENGLYRVPVPSMSDWFLENYLPEKGSYPAKSASPEQV